MRVLWLSHFVPAPPAGGALQRSHGLLHEASRRHEVHLVALNQRQLLPDRPAVRAALGQLACCRSVATFPIPAERSAWRRAALVGDAFFRSAPFDVRWLTSADLAADVARRLGREAFDLVHVDTPGLLPNLPTDVPCPILLNHHNIESCMTIRRAERDPRWWARLYLRRDAGKLRELERRWCPRVAMNVVVSSLDARRLRAVAGDEARVRVVPNGVDVAYMRTNQHGDPAHLIFTGSLGWYPNHRAARLLLDAIWPALAGTDGDWRLSLVGRGPPPDVRAATRDPRVSVPGAVPDIRPYVADAGIYVCPITDGGGTRLKILDALAMRRAVVATGLAVEGLGLEEGVHFLRAESASDFVAQIHRLRRDDVLRDRLAAAGRATVESRYAWPAIGEALEEAYQEAIGAGLRTMPA